MLLAIDTATRLAGIALYDGSGLQGELLWHTGDNHTVELLPLIVRLCEHAGVRPQSLSAVGVSIGPGSFTGLRVGLSVGKGLALALNIPIIGIPTLDATAYAHRVVPLPVCAVLPAGRGRLCVATYSSREGQWRRRGEYRLIAACGLAELICEPTWVCGEIGPQLAKDMQIATAGRAILASPALATRRSGYLAEMAWTRLEAGQLDDLSSLGPIYLQSL